MENNTKYHNFKYIFGVIIYVVEYICVHRAQPSEAIRRILDMNPTRLVTHAPTNNMQIGRVKSKTFLSFYLRQQ